MNNSWEEHLPCAALCLGVLALFYGIYFTKVLRRGIQTRQIGRRKEKTIHTVELCMSAATLGVVIARLLSVAYGWSRLPAGALHRLLHGTARRSHFLLSVVCMKDSWRAGIPDMDETEFITTGVYRFSRNPAFLGFDFVYIGVLLLYFNPLTAAFTLFSVVMLHLQILQEERYLTAAFGEPYTEYKKHVFRYLGRKKTGKHGQDARAARAFCK